MYRPVMCASVGRRLWFERAPDPLQFPARHLAALVLSVALGTATVTLAGTPLTRDGTYPMAPKGRR